jgi:hypothetical protein
MRGNILCAAIKYWISLKQSARAEPVRLCYDWQVGQPKVECWARRLRKELDTVGLVYMTECETDRNKDQLKHSWGKWEYTTCCTVKEKSGIAWFHLKI